MANTTKIEDTQERKKVKRAARKKAAPKAKRTEPRGSKKKKIKKLGRGQSKREGLAVRAKAPAARVVWGAPFGRRHPAPLQTAALKRNGRMGLSLMRPFLAAAPAGRASAFCGLFRRDSLR